MENTVAECATIARELEGFPTTDDPGTGHDLHGCPSSHCIDQVDGLGGAWPWLTVRALGKEAHRYTMEGYGGHHNRDSVVSGTQGSRRQ